jgi:hypothetical protein
VIETSLVAIVGPLLGGRIFPDSAPFNTPKPWATYQQVGGDSPTFIDNTPVGIRNALIQINVWAATRAQATTLILQIEAALIAAGDMQVRPSGAFLSVPGYDNTIYGAQQDFDCWQTTA